MESSRVETTTFFRASELEPRRRSPLFLHWQPLPSISDIDLPAHQPPHACVCSEEKRERESATLVAGCLRDGFCIEFFESRRRRSISSASSAVRPRRREHPESSRSMHRRIEGTTKAALARAMPLLLLLVFALLLFSTNPASVRSDSFFFPSLRSLLETKNSTSSSSPFLSLSHSLIRPTTSEGAASSRSSRRRRETQLRTRSTSTLSSLPYPPRPRGPSRVTSPTPSSWPGCARSPTAAAHTWGPASTRSGSP